MKDLFKGYYRPTEKEFETLWKNATFVFDTNVLLNLYRYQPATRDSLFEVIKQLKKRIWIPYHVGLEFQRRRLNVISDQYKRYSEVQKVIEKAIATMQTELQNLQLEKRHSHINPEPLINEVNKIKNDFITELNTLAKSSINVSSEDDIRNKIDSLFQGKIGDPPPDPKFVSDLFIEAEERFQNAIPPGFEDSKKEKHSESVFTYGGITYKSQFGDFIIWKQIIMHVSINKLKDLIFVTDDNKSDWSWKIDGKTIAVRPELVDELSRETDIERFHIYNTESFLNYANKQLGTKVAEEAIEEVRDISVAQQIASDEQVLIKIEPGLITNSVKEATVKKLAIKYSNIVKLSKGHLDFSGFYEGKKYGFKIFIVNGVPHFKHSLSKYIEQYHSSNSDNYFQTNVIFVVLKNNELDIIKEYIKKFSSNIPDNFKIIISNIVVDKYTNTIVDIKPTWSYLQSAI